MSSAFPNRSDTRDAVEAVAIVAVVLGAGGIVFGLWMSTPLRTFAVLSAGGLVVAGALMSGNPRLFSLWGLMLTVPLNLSKRFGPMFLGKPGGEDSFRVEISDLFLLVLVGFIIWDLLKGRRKGIRIPKLTFPWLLLIAIGVIWIIVGPWRTTAAHEVVRMLKVTLLFLTIANEVRTPMRVWHCCAALTVGALGEATIGMIQYSIRGLIGLEILGETSEGTIRVLEATSVQGAEVFRPSALLQHANLMGIYLAIMLPFAVALLITSRRTSFKAFCLITLAVASPAVVVSLSRSAWLSAFIAVLIVLALLPLHPRLRFRSLKVGGLVGVLGILVFLGLSGPILQRALNSKDDSTVARELYKSDARKMIADAPWLGHGLNSYVFELPHFTTVSMATYGGNLPSVHHIFYLWWAETGIVGMLLFCSVWAGMIWVGVSNLLVKNELLFAVNAACLAGVICLIPDAFLSFTLRVNTMLRMFWILGGLIMAIRYMRLRELDDERIRSEATSPSMLAPIGGTTLNA